jgi:hypothetical protein
MVFSVGQEGVCLAKGVVPLQWNYPFTHGCRGFLPSRLRSLKHPLFEFTFGLEPIVQLSA